MEAAGEVHARAARGEEQQRPEAHELPRAERLAVRPVEAREAQQRGGLEVRVLLEPLQGRDPAPREALPLGPSAAAELAPGRRAPVATSA